MDSFALECARNYTALQGRLYGRTLADCEQYITVPENHTITLYFASLDFRTTQECSETKAPLTVSQLRMGHIFANELNLNDVFVLILIHNFSPLFSRFMTAETIIC